ncbi:MAG: PTS fructose transporter subunit IIA [Burkholderiales bacterium]|nr:PTS fructose transporter subunit IIA [Burkholderiales bacterium]
MTRILVLAHSPLASALRAVAMHTYPECAVALEAVDAEPSQDAAALEAALRLRLDAAGAEDTLILVDAFGATPCNAALRVADGVHVRVVCGVNVPMLWRSLCYRGETLEALAQRASSGAVQGVMVLEPQAAQPRSGEGDGT